MKLNQIIEIKQIDQQKIRKIINRNYKNKIERKYNSNKQRQKQQKIMIKSNIQILREQIQLKRLNEEIMQLHNNYKKLQYQNENMIKYKLKQKMNIISQKAQNKIKNKELKERLQRDQQMNKQLDQKQRTLVIQKYMGEMLQEISVNEAFIKNRIVDRNMKNRLIDKNNQKRQDHHLNKKILKESSKQNKLNNNLNNEIQLQKIKNKNHNMIKQIQRLKEQLQMILTYNNKKQQLTHINITQDKCNKGTEQNQINRTNKIKQQQQQLQNKIQCINKLINTKSFLIHQSQSNLNQLLLSYKQSQSKVKYLHQHQIKLTHQRIPKLQKKLNILLNQLKDITTQQLLNKQNNSNYQLTNSNLSTQYKNQFNHSNKELNTKDKLPQSIIYNNELSSMKSLISNSLYQLINTDKINHINFQLSE